MKLDSEVKQRIRARTGWLIPYHLQLLFAELREQCGDRGLSPSIELVDDVYEALLSPGKGAYFDYWEQRLQEELGQPEARHAITLLNSIAKDPQGATIQTLRSVLGALIQNPDERDERLKYLLDVLGSDGYLTRIEERHVFRSSLLREYWLRRVAL